MNQTDYQQRYNRWWLGQEVRFNDGEPWKVVTKINLIGPASFVYGCVELEFADGSSRMVPTHAYRPRKFDVKVRDASRPQIRCPQCHRVSYNPSDVEKRYCGYCHMFHDDMK